jgi:hypothetical protein
MEQTTIRPAVTRWGVLAGLGIVGLMALVLLASFSRRDPERLWVSVGINAAIIVLLIIVHFARTRIDYGDGVYRWRRWIRRGEFRVDDVRLVVGAERLLGAGQIAGVGIPVLVVMGYERDRLLFLDGLLWRARDLFELAEDFRRNGAEVEWEVGPVRQAKLTHDYPHSMSFRQRHPGFVVLGVLCIVVTVFAFGSLISALI